MRGLSVYRRQDGKWDWRLRARNGEIIGGSQQGYENQQDAETIARRIISGEFADVEVWIDGVKVSDDTQPDPEPVADALPPAEDLPGPPPRVITDNPQA